MGCADEIREMLSRSSWIRKMFEEGAKLKEKFGEENVFDFSLGNPYGEPPEEFYEELSRLISAPSKGAHGYMENAGFEEVRARKAEELTSLTGIKFTARNVVMTCGAAGGLNVVLKSILNPGDEVIILAPYFVEYIFYIKNHGGVPKIARTDGNFDPDLNVLEETLTNRTRAIIVNTPNNPTGRVYGRYVLEELSRLLEEWEEKTGNPVYLISDEPYREIIYDTAEFHPPARYVRNSFVVYSHSKDLNVPGERIGYAAISPDATDSEEIFSAMVFANRTLGFVNAPALMQRVAGILTGIKPDLAPYSENRSFLSSLFQEIGVEFVKPDGAFYFFPKTPGGLSDEEFAELARSERILIVPGGGFGTPGYFRVAYCTSPEIVKRSEESWRRLASRWGK